MRLAEFLVLPDRGADRIDEVHLAGAEQVVLGPEAHCMKYQAASFCLPKELTWPATRSRRWASGPWRPGLAAKACEAEIALLLVVAAIHEVAEDVGVEDHRRGAGAEIGADLIPGVGRPVLRADSWIICTQCLWKALEPAVFIAALSLPSVTVRSFWPKLE